MTAGEPTSILRPRSVADAVGATIAALGVRDAFGVVGSGNLVVTNAMRAGGVRFHAARHEGGAVCMADGYARVSGAVGVCSVHQGPGLTNTLTGLAEAAKSRTPLLVLSGDTPAAARTSNFRINQHGLVESVGAIAERVHGARTAVDDAQRAFALARDEHRPVVLMLAIDVQSQAAPELAAVAPTALTPRHHAPALVPAPAASAVTALADLLAAASRPALIAGRGAVLSDAGADLERLGDQVGALLATSAPANGLFAGLPFALGISGGFASPFATELLAQADVIVGFGASLNFWTTRHGALVSADTRVAQVDVDARALGRHRGIDVAVVGDVGETARAVLAELQRRGHAGGAGAGAPAGWRTPELEGRGHAGGDTAGAHPGWRSPELAARIARRRWREEPYEDAGGDGWIDPRSLSIALDAALPAERTVAVDSGHFLGYPAMFLGVPDARSWVFPNGFQAVGLGLGCAIGAAVARPERITVAAVGDGGTFMALPELETAARLGLRLLVVVYDDAAYGAEVHHFAPLGQDVSLVRFPDADLAAIARAAGASAITVRAVDDLAPVRDWVQAGRGPLLIDAKVNPTVRAEWLEEAFRAG